MRQLEDELAVLEELEPTPGLAGKAVAGRVVLVLLLLQPARVLAPRAWPALGRLGNRRLDGLMLLLLAGLLLVLLVMLLLGTSRVLAVGLLAQGGLVVLEHGLGRLAGAHLGHGPHLARLARTFRGLLAHAVTSGRAILCPSTCKMTMVR